MGLWRRLFGKRDRPTEEPAEKPAERAPRGGEAPTRFPLPSEQPARNDVLIDRLRRLDQPGGADADGALLALRQAAGTPEQARIVAVILQAIRPGAAHDPLRVGCARLLADGGEVGRALELARSSQSIAAMMLAAELHASSGDLAHAVASIERVLARAIDTPGARERHERWCAQLGRPVRPVRTSDDATQLGRPTRALPFRLLREVARGGAGTIYEAEDELLGRRVAFKVYHRRDEGCDRGAILQEARRAVELAGPGVVQIFDVDPDGGWLASEWLALGSLRDLLRAGRVADIAPMSAWIPRLLEALGRVHAKGLVHGDLKPGNILFRTLAEPVLSDFGMCRRSAEPGGGGTVGYLSPERLGGKGVDPRDDVYAFGRILEDVLCAGPPRGPLEMLDPAIASVMTWEPDVAELSRACLRDVAARPADAAALLGLIGRNV